MASDPPFLREATRQCVVQRRWLNGNPGSSRTRFRDRPETVRLHRGIDVHLHPGTAFGIIPESRSRSPGFPRTLTKRALSVGEPENVAQTSAEEGGENAVALSGLCEETLFYANLAFLP